MISPAQDDMCRVQGSSNVTVRVYDDVEMS